MSGLQAVNKPGLRLLGDIVTFLDHKRRPVREADRRPGPYPYLGANGQQGVIDGYLFDEPLVLLAEDGGHFNNPERGIAYRVSGKVWVNNHAHVLRPGAQVDWAYLARVLENRDVRSFISGTTRGKLTKAQAEKILIPLPPIPEQRRIAAILDQADALRAKRRAALAQLDEMAQAIFVEMFGSPSTNNKSWPTKPIGVICKNEDSLRIPIKSADRDLRPGVFPYYGASGIIDNYDDFIYDGERLLVAEDGANLVTRSTPIAFMASGRFWVNNHAHVLAFNGEAHLRFLETALEQIDLKPYISGSAQPKLTRGSLDRIVMPIPPLELQAEYVRRLAQTETIRHYSVQHYESAKHLFASLQHRAFTGAL